MKHYYFLICAFVALVMCSCGTTYQYYQVFDVKPVEEKSPVKEIDGGLLYENDECAVLYSFWDEHGSASYEIYNKTDDYLYVDLAKCFFIKNGLSYDEYLSRSWTNNVTNASSYSLSASASTSGSLGSYYGNVRYYSAGQPVGVYLYNPSYSTSGSATTTSYSSKSSSITHYEQPVVTIPPKTSKIIGQYKIQENRYVACGLLKFPKDSCKMDFDLDKTPIRFSNYISYKIGNSETYKNINNEFYVSRVTNYAFPSIMKPVERLIPCKLEVKKVGGFAVYDMEVKFNTNSSFYYYYTEFTTSQLYKIGYVYNWNEDGWFKK